MRKIALSLGCAAMLGTASTSFGALGVVFEDDFESYTSTSTMSAVWSGFDGELRTEIDYDFDGTPDETNNTGWHEGGSVNAMALATPVVATTDEWIKLSVDIFDIATNSENLDPLDQKNPDNKRMSLGLRDTTVPSNIIELGMWNDPGHFAYRAILFGSAADDPNWVAWDMGTEIVGEGELPVNRFRGAGWHTYHVTVTPDTLIFEFDLDRDGTIDATDTYDVGVESGLVGFNELRFGGPSGVGSDGGAVHFDNVKLEIIAPPVTLVGDLNGDGFVGIDDLNLILGNWNLNVPPGDPLADPSGDGFIGIDDLNQVLGNWNAGTPPAAGAAVPEPATLALLGLGGVAMLRRR